MPEEFLDTLTYNVMKNPVKLPSSGNVIDKLTIKKHLLNDKTDPFTREHLEENMLIE